MPTQTAYTPYPPNHPDNGITFALLSLLITVLIFVFALAVLAGQDSVRKRITRRSMKRWDIEVGHVLESCRYGDDLERGAVRGELRSVCGLYVAQKEHVE